MSTIHAEPAETLTAPGRDNWVTCGIVVVGAAAAAISWTGWFLLAQLCGWNRWLAILLPLSVDVYVITSARVWLRLDWVSPRTRKFAAVSTMLAVVFSILANAAYHLMVSYGIHHAPWGVVVSVSGLAPLMLALVAHLQSRLNNDRLHAGQDAPPELVTPEVQPEAPPVVSSVVQDAGSVQPRPSGSGSRRRHRSGQRRRSGSSRRSGTDDLATQAAAFAILAVDPDITGKDLGIRLATELGRPEPFTESYGCRLKRIFNTTVPGPDQQETDPAGSAGTPPA